jgi:hypothetical protein
VFSGALEPSDSMTFSAISALGEATFNLTEAPLTSSAALSIAVPDGDPFDAIGVLAGLSSFIAAIFAAAAYGFDGGAAKWAGATMLGDIIAFGGGLLAVESAVIATHLPAPSNNATVRKDYQADSAMAAIALAFGIGGAVATGVATAQSGGLAAIVGLGISGVVIGASIGVIVSNWHTEGTDP